MGYGPRTTVDSEELASQARWTGPFVGNRIEIDRQLGGAVTEVLKYYFERVDLTYDPERGLLVGLGDEEPVEIQPAMDDLFWLLDTHEEDGERLEGEETDRLLQFRDTLQGWIARIDEHLSMESG